VLLRPVGLHRDLAVRPGLSSGTIAPRPARPATAKEVAARAAAGDVACAATFERYEERFARAIAHVINILDPDVIVLGGGISNVDRLYANVPKRWVAWVFSDRVDTRLVRNVHGDSSGVRGAAWLWGGAMEVRPPSQR
jgi:fructokinase